MGKLSQFIVARLSESVDRSPAYWSAKFNLFRQYAKVELAPPGPSDIAKFPGELVKFTKSTGNIKNLTVREMIFSGLVFVEVMCWFYVGECIGKRHVKGYYLSPEAKNTYQPRFKPLFQPYADEE